MNSCFYYFEHINPCPESTLTNQERLGVTVCVKLVTDCR